MIGEGEPIQDSSSTLEAAKDAVKSVADTVQATTRTVADAIEAGRQPGALLDRLAAWTQASPLQALGAAFIVGLMVGRRR
jgi:hypothetical protein